MIGKDITPKSFPKGSELRKVCEMYPPGRTYEDHQSTTAIRDA
jgi:hypothetical protein